MMRRIFTSRILPLIGLGKRAEAGVAFVFHLLVFINQG